MCWTSSYWGVMGVYLSSPSTSCACQPCFEDVFSRCSWWRTVSSYMQTMRFGWLHGTVMLNMCWDGCQLSLKWMRVSTSRSEATVLSKTVDYWDLRLPQVKAVLEYSWSGRLTSGSEQRSRRSVGPLWWRGKLSIYQSIASPVAVSFG